MISDYSGLQTSISRWLHRSDLVSVIPDLIMLAETRFNRNLRVRQMEKKATLTLTDGAGALPADWLELVGSPKDGETRFQFVARDEFCGLGSIYTLIGNEIHVSHNGSGPPTVDICYYSRIPALSDQNASNWLLQDGPDVYLYGALLESAPYIKNDERIETWRALLQVALTDLQMASDRGKYSGGTLVID